MDCGAFPTLMYCTPNSMLRGSGSFDQHPSSIFSSTFGDVALDASAASARSTGTRVEASGNWQLQDWDEPIGADSND